jgi:Domain of unknown function (DUF1906)
VRNASLGATSFFLFFYTMVAGISVCGAAVQAAEYCAKDPRVAAVDLSAPVDQNFLNQMRIIGINTVIRYYDHPDETLPGKTLTRTERDFILGNGFKIAVVFQHHNDQMTSFTGLRGRTDAERALALAMANNQQPGSAIYFGVDGPWHRDYELTNIMDYFREVKARLAGASYRVGVYGSGLVCEMLLANALADLCWLAAPDTWPQYLDYYATRKWGLAQLPTTRCGGRSVDFNQVNGLSADYGQFGY